VFTFFLLAFAGIPLTGGLHRQVRGVLARLGPGTRPLVVRWCAASAVAPSSTPGRRADVLLATPAPDGAAVGASPLTTVAIGSRAATCSSACVPRGPRPGRQAASSSARRVPSSPDRSAALPRSATPAPRSRGRRPGAVEEAAARRSAERRRSSREAAGTWSSAAASGSGRCSSLLAAQFGDPRAAGS
jgi:hypothetical protein